MKKVVTTDKEKPRKRLRPALTPEARENQLISLAYDLAEKQLLEGTASSQVITQFLKLGSIKERKELEKLEQENKLLIAKTEALESAKKMEGLYEEALQAFKTYSGSGGEDDSDL